MKSNKKPDSPSPEEKNNIDLSELANDEDFNRIYSSLKSAEKEYLRNQKKKKGS